MADSPFAIDRLTRRHQPRALVVSIGVPQPGAAPGQPVANGTAIVVPANVVDISVIGACLETAAYGHVVAGTIVGLSIGNASGTAEVRYSVPGAVFGRAIYGVQFLPTGDLQDAVNGIIGAMRNSESRSIAHWNT